MGIIPFMTGLDLHFRPEAVSNKPGFSALHLYVLQPILGQFLDVRR